MYKDEYLFPNINDGRFFVSPILGCTGACSYCYLKINNFGFPRKNKLTKEELLTAAQQSPDFIFGVNGTIISIGAWGDISISINDFDTAGKYQAATWEGCVVKMADKIAYVGRDIEDAISLGFLDQTAQNHLLRMARSNDERVMNTTVIMHNMIIDICQNSSPDNGINMSPRFSQQLGEIKSFNYKHIYRHNRLEPFKHYSELVITQIFNTLLSFYDGRHTWNLLAENKHFTPTLIDSFEKWLARYCSETIIPAGKLKELSLQCENEKIYQELQTCELYIRAIIDYISGMTDRFAVSLFQELLEY